MIWLNMIGNLKRTHENNFKCAFEPCFLCGGQSLIAGHFAGFRGCKYIINTPPYMSSNDNFKMAAANVVENSNDSSSKSKSNQASWVKLNVGGQTFLTTKTTLTKEPNNFLCRLCNEEADLPTDRVSIWKEVFDIVALLNVLQLPFALALLLFF